MAQSALRALTQQLMQGGPAPSGMASYQTAVQNAANRPQASANMLGGLPFSKEQAAYLAAQFAPGAAMADASGMMPSMPEKGQGLMSTAQSGQFNPSIRQNLQQGNYLDAALQGLGAVGDAAYAIPLAGLTVGNVLKAPRAIDKALDMSQAARMQRAREQDFDVSNVSYRGLSQPYSSRNAGYYQMFTSNPDEASEYAMSNPAGNGNVIPAYLRKGNALSIDAGGRNFNAIGVESLPDSIRSYLHPSITSVARTDDIAHAAKAAGYDSVTINNVYDNAAGEIAMGKNQGSKNELTADQILQELGFSLENMGASIPTSDNYNPPIKRNPVTITAVFDPSNIRSVNAAFDPAKRNSANLSAGIMGSAVGLSALRQLMPQQEQE